MDEIQQREWQELKASARKLIFDAYDVQEPDLQCLARVIVAPSFSTVENWRLLRRHKAGPESYVVRWIFWSPERDLERILAPTRTLIVERRYRPRQLGPMLERGEAELAPELAEALLHRLASVAVPVYAPPTGVGLDGATYHLRTGNSFCGGEYSWWETPPEPWVPLHEAAGALLSAFRETAL
jgi:hypothetical protein